MVTLCLSLSFSQDAKDAFSASVIFLAVPGVRGGTGAGKSVIQNKKLIKDSKYLDES